MSDGYPAGLAPRKRGGQGKFVGDTLKALLSYLAQDGSTIEKAAQIFDCSTSTIEKKLARLRAEANAIQAKPAPGAESRPPGTRRSDPARIGHAAHGA